MSDRLPTGIGLPNRDAPVSHRCRCELVLIEDQSRRDRCGARVDNPDDPYCQPCWEQHVNTNDRVPRHWVQQMASFTPMKEGGTEI